MDAKHTPGPWRWEYNASSKSVSIVGGAPRYDKTVMDFARWGMGRAAPMFNEAVTDPQGWHIITRLPDRPDWVAPIPGREHHKDWCMTVIHPDAVLMARAPELLAETTRLRAEVDLVIAQREAWRVSAIACQRSSAEFAADADRLRAENTSLLADAERYRWLKANRLGETLVDDGTLCVEFYCDFEHYNDVDAAIDKARKP